VIGPSRLIACFVDRPWGATDLSPYYAGITNKTGEVWFCPSSHDSILVKFIFAAECLSVQVHPDDAYARKHENSRGKTEMWHILDAKPGAEILIGFRESVDRKRLRKAIEDGNIDKLLNRIQVSKGETYFIPAGTVHALGAGVTLCEIQQNSDVTYRLFDYGRGRELHIDKAMDVVDPGPYDASRRLPVICEHFSTEEIDLTRGAAAVEPECLLVAIAGDGGIAGQPFRQGEVWSVPAGAGEIHVTAGKEGRLLRVSSGQ
jgi:mannose-6-phosphate isomerase